MDFFKPNQTNAEVLRDLLITWPREGSLKCLLFIAKCSHFYDISLSWKVRYPDIKGMLVLQSVIYLGIGKYNLEILIQE